MVYFVYFTFHSFNSETIEIAFDSWPHIDINFTVYYIQLINSIVIKVILHRRLIWIYMKNCFSP